jgi:hypothetical protein
VTLAQWPLTFVTVHLVMLGKFECGAADHVADASMKDILHGILAE